MTWNSPALEEPARESLSVSRGGSAFSGNLPPMSLTRGAERGRLAGLLAAFSSLSDDISIGLYGLDGEFYTRRIYFKR